MPKSDSPPIPGTKMTADFSNKPETQKLADQIVSIVASLGPSHSETKSQLTFGRKRKFIWLWSYQHTADGTLYMTVCLDREIRSTHFQYVKQVGANRWNHHVVVRSTAQIEASWFKDLVEKGYEFGGS